MFGRPWVRVGLVVAVAAAAGVGVWLVVRGNGSAPRARTSNTVDLSARNLQTLSRALGRAIYWAGPRQSVTYEFTVTADQRTYVRYLPLGVAAGSAKTFLTVGTYPVADAFAVTSGAARRPGTVRVAVGGGGVAFYSRRRPTNIYLAFPGSDVQIEVYDPSADLARRLVTGGHVRLVTPSSAPAPAPAVPTTRVATSRGGLERLAAALGRPIYWLGPLAGLRLELTRTADGRVYVLYVPSAVPFGTHTPLLTVATYPVAQGLGLTTAASREAGMVRIPLPNGAVAFFSRSRPTNVYVAFRGVGEQIEVFDPSARRVHALVAAHRVQPIS
jgi:hypothetical protein